MLSCRVNEWNVLCGSYIKVMEIPKRYNYKNRCNFNAILEVIIGYDNVFIHGFLTSSEENIEMNNVYTGKSYQEIVDKIISDIINEGYYGTLNIEATFDPSIPFGQIEQLVRKVLDERRKEDIDNARMARHI